ncbi:hypothetical protein J7K50_07215, partial [bacterium]|nr:hypothetical protein [bacterium]
MNAGRILRDYCGSIASLGAFAFFAVLAAFVSAAVFIASCKSGGSVALPGKSDGSGISQSDSLSIGDPSPSNSNASSSEILDVPSTDELETMLRGELARLGVDVERAVAKAPTGAENKVFDLAATVIDPDGPAGPLPPEGVTLTWTERLIGDFDQSGEVGISDITPIAMNYQAQVAYDDPALHGGIEWWPAGDPDDDGGAKSGAAIGE